MPIRPPHRRGGRGFRTIGDHHPSAVPVDLAGGAHDRFGDDPPGRLEHLEVLLHRALTEAEVGGQQSGAKLSSFGWRSRMASSSTY
jgi:hypothetical protein